VSRTGKRAKRQLTADIDLKKGDLLGGKKIICIIGGAIMMVSLLSAFHISLI